MKLKICMLHRSLDADMRVVPQLGICNYLTNFDHQVTWIVSLGEDGPPQQFCLKGAKVYDVPYRHYVPGNSLPARILNRIPNVMRRMLTILNIFREGEHNLVFVRDELSDGLIAVYLKRRYRIPFVYELSNPPEQRLGGFRIEPRRPRLLHYLVLRFYTWLELRIVKKADLVLTTTKWFEDGLVRKGIPKSKLMAHHNGVDIDSFVNIDGTDIRSRYHLADSKVIVYVGTMDKRRYLNVLITAFSKVRVAIENVRLLMVGEGSDGDHLRRLAAELGIRDDVIFTGQVRQSGVPGFIAAADIGVSPVPPFSFYKVSSPIKMFEYMAMAKPVVANGEIFEHKEVLEESGGGIIVPFDPGAFANAIIELLDGPQRAVEMGRRGQEWVMKNRSYEVLARRLEKRYLELFSR